MLADSALSGGGGGAGCGGGRIGGRDLHRARVVAGHAAAAGNLVYDQFRLIQAGLPPVLGDRLLYGA